MGSLPGHLGAAQVVRSGLSPRGHVFTGAVMSRLCRKLGIARRAPAVDHHPGCNGQVERLNRTLLQDIRELVAADEDWIDLLPS